MPDDTALALRDVTKTYRLYSSLADQALDVLGLSWIRFWRGLRYNEYLALDHVSLVVKRGERVGVVGRNGAGKTTMLKLITGNFSPTTGTVDVYGRVQALFNLGLGFHPEFSGLDNIRSSLAYCGLSGSDLKRAIEDVIDFAELGEYLEQPLKTYSLGMQTRLMFAASTAIRPDILIVDEILGAGDAYFSAKSAHRMEALAKNGCTLLLVSHSMQQILQFCNRAIWLETGKVVMEGDPLQVVKAYEEYSQRLESAASGGESAGGSILANANLRQRILEQVFRVHSGDADSSQHASTGGVSRWVGQKGVKINSVRVLSQDGQLAPLVHKGDAVRIEIQILAEEAGDFPCSFVIVLFTRDGRVLSRHCSEPYSIRLREAEPFVVSLVYDPLVLGAGSYFFSAAVYKELDLNNVASAKAYDLLSRSFEFKVSDEFIDDPSVFHHPAKWVVETRPA